MNGRLNVQRCGFVFLLFPIDLFLWTVIVIWQARIALLEGERRSFENIKLDLMRRIKMLEYALRMERSVYSYFPLHDFPPYQLFKDPSNLLNQLPTPLLPQNFLPFKETQLLYLKKMTHIVKKKTVAAAHQGVKVCLACRISCYFHLTFSTSRFPPSWW